MSYGKLTPDDIDRLREQSLEAWAESGTSINQAHRYLARAVEEHVLGDRAALNEEIITLQAALAGRHEDVARLNIRVGQLEEALRQVGLGKGAEKPSNPVSEGFVLVSVRALENIVDSWDGCLHDGVDIGAALCEQFARIQSQQGDGGSDGA